ncbi:drug resistance transporter, Bcr/CflA subfamily [Kaistia soli DSM 19436]|uniref:Bcr/CflA family efflux transporter n=1 Tax=Kaistia soli DSM 19436 TaxID=1122133 RepID=A0A1M4UB06_9HYPH|nr:multidrug effflux MFS transporter [Kaistia soli]SHE53818.1 drug resistance transporter, Bcr/CflA subfamily [Kaistia soli DSM 19436]
MRSATIPVRHGTRMLVTLAVLLAFASISTDLFLPALPAMSEALKASEGSLQFTISGYLLGFGFGQLFWGPISDRFGRRAPVAIGVAIFVIGSAGCALSTDVWQIVGWRVVQALGASAGVALARAMVRDLYDRNHAAKVLSGLMTVMAVAPLLGPSVGAQILAAFSWQAIFWSLVLIGGATLVAILALPETLPVGEREVSPIWHAFGDYPPLLRNRTLIGYAAAVGFYYFGIFANIAGGAFAFISYHHLTPQQYGLVFASGVVGVMVANIANVRLVTRIGSDRLLIVGASGAALSGLWLGVVTTTDLGGVWGAPAGPVPVRGDERLHPCQCGRRRPGQCSSQGGNSRGPLRSHSVWQRHGRLRVCRAAGERNPGADGLGHECRRPGMPRKRPAHGRRPTPAKSCLPEGPVSSRSRRPTSIRTRPRSMIRCCKKVRSD